MPGVAAHRLRILFVDDEAPIRLVMKNELPRLGHDVTICEDGRTALRALEDHPFDAAIVDLRMPGIGGWDVVQHLKKTCPETDVIIHTGHGDIDDAIQAVRMGAYDFLRKPCTLGEIANVLSRVAEKKLLSNKAIALEAQLKSVPRWHRSDRRNPRPCCGSKNSSRKSPRTNSRVLVLRKTRPGQETGPPLETTNLTPLSKIPFVAFKWGPLTKKSL